VTVPAVLVLVTLRGVDHFATPKNFAAIDATLDFLSRPSP
jgi:hypothetical protein